MKIKTLAHETIETIYSLYVWMNDVVVETIGWSKYGTVKSAPSMLTSTQSKPKPKTQPIKPAAKRPWNMTATVAIENRFLKFYSLYRTKHNEFGLSLLQRHFITKANFIELVFWIEEKATNFYVSNDL